MDWTGEFSKWWTPCVVFLINNTQDLVLVKLFSKNDPPVWYVPCLLPQVELCGGYFGPWLLAPFFKGASTSLESRLWVQHR
jgi:hypothetical protein